MLPSAVPRALRSVLRADSDGEKRRFAGKIEATNIRDGFLRRSSAQTGPIGGRTGRLEAWNR